MSEQIDNSLLSLARQQVFDEYIKTKADELAEWLLKCDTVWKAEGVMLPYPSFSFYPNDEDIIARAKLLSKTSKESTIEVVEPEEVEQTEEVKQEVITETEKPSVNVFYKSRKKWKK